MKLQKSQKDGLATQEYMNLMDVRGGVLYTQNNKIAKFIKVSPISTALMTETEKELLTLKMTREISPTKVSFKILFLTRPTDVRQIVDYYEGIKATTENMLKRESLTKTIRFFSQLATNGNVLERQTFLRIKGNASTQSALDELQTKTIEMRNALNNCGISCNICDDTEIINMLGLFYSPAFNFSLPVDTTPKMTFLSGGVTQ